MSADKPRALLIGISTHSQLPWWWKHVDHEALSCQLDCETVVVKGGRPRRLLSLQTLRMVAQCLAILLRARRQQYRYIFTFEGGWLSFIVASIQTAFLMRRPRHVILQFIMRERTGSLTSRAKYAFMKWCFSSVYLCVCSSRPECEYYASAFNWPLDKVSYAPLHTDPAFLSTGRPSEQPFVISAGRTFRDYRTLLQSFATSGVPLTIVASPSSIGDGPIPGNVRVLHDLPLAELLGLIGRSTVVIVPLEERAISIGQSVVLQAMAMAKPVIATRVNGTVD